MQNSFYLKYGKRFFDLVVSIFGTIILLPLFIKIAILIKLLDGGPIFYKQKRIGQYFKPFILIKFRSMILEADKKGTLITKENDPRITQIGTFLRKTKLDEIPQLLNVIRGDMSLVGPRPEVEKYVSIFKHDYSEILKIKPGITDFATIEFRNEETILKLYENAEDVYIRDILPRKIKLYKRYIAEMSFFTDIKLILKTFFKIIIQR